MSSNSIALRPQFCTLKMRKLQLLSLSIKQCKFQYRLFGSFFFVEIKMNFKIVVNVVAKLFVPFFLDQMFLCEFWKICETEKLDFSQL